MSLLLSFRADPITIGCNVPRTRRLSEAKSKKIDLSPEYSELCYSRDEGISIEIITINSDRQYLHPEHSFEPIRCHYLWLQYFRTFHWSQ